MSSLDNKDRAIGSKKHGTPRYIRSTILPPFLRPILWDIFCQSKYIKPVLIATIIFVEHPMHAFYEHGTALPIRLHHKDGNPVKHGSHFLRKRILREDHLRRRHHRKRRTVEFAKDDSDIHNPTVANYSIEAFGKVFRFHLVPYSEFISPLFTLDYKGNLTSQFDDLIEDTPRHCFFVGHVNFKVEEKVVVSLCGGMVSRVWVIFKDALFCYAHLSVCFLNFVNAPNVWRTPRSSECARRKKNKRSIYLPKSTR